MRKRFYGCENGMPIEDLDQYFSINKNYFYIKENQEEVDHKHPPNLKKRQRHFDIQQPKLFYLLTSKFYETYSGKQKIK